MVVPSGEETSRNVSLIDIDLLRGPPRSRSAPTESPWNRQVGYATPIEMAPRAPPGQRTTLMTCLAPGLPQDEGPDPRVAQEEPSPHQHSEDGGEQEPWVLDAHLGRHGPAQVAREQDRPEERRTRHRAEERADAPGHPPPPPRARPARAPAPAAGGAEAGGPRVAPCAARRRGACRRAGPALSRGRSPRGSRAGPTPRPP